VLSWYQKGKTNLDLNEAKDNWVLGLAVASAGPYANNQHLAPERYQHLITHIFTGRMLFPMPNQVTRHRRHTPTTTQKCIAVAVVLTSFSMQNIVE